MIHFRKIKCPNLVPNKSKGGCIQGGPDSIEQRFRVWGCDERPRGQGRVGTEIGKTNQRGETCFTPCTSFIGGSIKGKGGGAGMVNWLRL